MSLAGDFDGHGNAPVQYHAHDTCVVLSDSIYATGHRNWLNICSVLLWCLLGSHTNKQNKCISLAGNFDGHDNARVHYKAHQHMHRAHCFNLSHWTLKLVEYLLRISPATARVPYKLLIANKCISLAGYFDGHGNAPVQSRAH